MADPDTSIARQERTHRGIEVADELHDEGGALSAAAAVVAAGVQQLVPVAGVRAPTVRAAPPPIPKLQAPQGLRGVVQRCKGLRSLAAACLGMHDKDTGVSAGLQSSQGSAAALHAAQ